MAKQKDSLFCSQCGHESSKWMGQCPACQAVEYFYRESYRKRKKEGEVFKDFCLSMNISGNRRGMKRGFQQGF